MQNIDYLLMSYCNQSILRSNTWSSLYTWTYSELCYQFRLTPVTSYIVNVTYVDSFTFKANAVYICQFRR